MHAHSLSDADRAFRRAFETFTVAPADFNHEAHVRLAYAYLTEDDVEEAVLRMRAALLAFLERNGVPATKYHETLTRAWVLAVRHFMNKGSTSSAADFIGRNPELLDSRIMLTHYSATVLFSPEARAAFVEPDLDPIPRHEGASMNLDISHEEQGHRGAFYVVQDGKRVAEMTYSRTSPTLVIIDHTEVDKSLGGKGVGRRLLDTAVQWARDTGTKVMATCPFAKAQFDRDPSIRDVLA